MNRSRHSDGLNQEGKPAMHTLALAGWIVIFGVLFVWQGIGLVRGPDWPTLSDMLRSFMRSIAGRSVLFGMWLWLGWHLFIRGWAFFMRSRV